VCEKSVRMVEGGNERIRKLRMRKRLEVGSKRKSEWGKINNDQQGVQRRDRRYIDARGSAWVCAYLSVHNCMDNTRRSFVWQASLEPIVGAKL
jgi:hypothetical protein